MSIENLNIERIPSEDIATWFAKVSRVKFALRSQTMVDSQDGQSAWELAATTHSQGIEHFWLDPVHRANAYESSILYELEGSMSLGGLKKAVDLTPKEYIDPTVHPTKQEVPTRKAVAERARQIGEQALLEGFGRLGMIRTEENGTKTVPEGLVAALMYQRANIRQDSDRRLYERSAEIDALRKRIETQAGARVMEFTFRVGGSRDMPVYRGVSYLNRADSEDGNHDFRAPTPIGMWWEELHSDFARIENINLTEIA